MADKPGNIKYIQNQNESRFITKKHTRSNNATDMQRIIAYESETSCGTRPYLQRPLFLNRNYRNNSKFTMETLT